MSFARLVATAALLLVAALWPSGGARAHAELILSEPADGAVIAQAPQEIRLRLVEDVAVKFSSIVLYDANGAVVDLSTATLDRPEPNMLRLPLPKLADGTYSVIWKALSAADGHFSRGFLVFGVGAGADVQAAARVDVAAGPRWIEIALRWVAYGGLLGLLGAFATIGLVINRLTGIGSDNVRAAVHRRMLTWGLACGIGAAVANLGLAAVQFAEVAGDGASGQLMWQLLSETQWGRVFVMREVLLGVLLAVAWLLRRPGATSARRLLWLSAADAVGIAALQASGSHAAGLSSGTWLAIAVDALHLLAGSVWIGGVIALAIGLLALLGTDADDRRGVALACWRRFSPLAALAAGVVIATGLHSMGRQVASIDALLTTAYGQALLVKIGLVMAIGAVGLGNAVLLHRPRLLGVAFRIDPTGLPALIAGWLRRLLRADVSLAALVIALTAVVTATPAPRDVAYSFAAEEARGTQTVTVDDLVVTLSVKPNRPGQNVLSILAASTRRPAPAEVLRVIARFTHLGRDTGRVSAAAQLIEPNRYLVNGPQLAISGLWRIDVVVRRKGIPDSVARFDWTVLPAGQVTPTWISKAALTPAIDAVALILAGFVVAGWAQSKRSGRRSSRSTLMQAV